MSKKKTIPVLPPGTTLIDTHCHLDMEGYAEDLGNTLRSAVSYGIEHIITIGIDYDSSRKAVAIADLFPNVTATIGIHPHDARNADEAVYAKLTGLMETHGANIVGYGEIGLDYVKQYSPREIQLKHFAHQLGIARELNLPVIVHDREAHEDTLRLLHDNGPFPAGGVMHCFSGDRDLADRVLDMGFHISIPGVVTFKNARILQDVVRHVPQNRILLETDGPFLAPEPFRGKMNRPEYLIFTAMKISELLNISIKDFADQTTRNAKQLFRIRS